MSGVSREIREALRQQAAIRARCFHPSGRFIEFEKEAIEQSIPERFEQQVRRYPDRLAVRSRTHAFTYTELNELANRVAHAILARRGAGEEPIALLLDQGAPLIAAIIGVLKAGKIYVPLDPLFPRARLSYMIEDARASLLVTSARHLAVAGELAPRGVTWIDIDALDPGLARANPAVAIAPDRGVHLLYTSGSTGQPKGVLQNHRNLLFEVLRITNSFHVCQDDRLALLHSCSSSASLRRIFPALLNGASLHLRDIKAEGTGDLPHWFMREAITISNGQRLLRDCVRSLTGEDQFPQFRLVVFGGEPIYRRDVENYKQYLAPNCVMLVNLVATETGSDRHYYIDKQTEITDTLLPVGYETEGTEVRLLDEGGQEAGPNQIGEIAVRSRYLALGYWRQPELTRDRFLPDPEGGDARIYLTGDLGRMDPDGCLFHLGRKDFQVKVRGYRIEAAEVETTLLNLGVCTEAVVLAREDRPGEERLVAYLMLAGRPAPTISALRSALVEKLPEPMIPATFVMLETFPRTATGKVDRKALPPPGRDRPALDVPYVAARTPVEEVLAGMWTNLLEVEPVGANDSFLELGGSSLAAARLLTQVSEAFRVEVPLGSFFERPTVAELAEALTALETAPGSVAAIARVRRQIDAMLPEEIEALLAAKKTAAADDGGRMGT